MLEQQNNLISELFIKMKVYVESFPKDCRDETSTQIGFAVVSLVGTFGGLPVEDMDPVANEMRERLTRHVLEKQNEGMSWDHIIPCISKAYIQFNTVYPGR